MTFLCWIAVHKIAEVISLQAEVNHMSSPKNRDKLSINRSNV